MYASNTLSNSFRKWCLSGLENGLPAVKRESYACAIAGCLAEGCMGRHHSIIYLPLEDKSLKQHFIGGFNKNYVSLNLSDSIHILLIVFNGHR